MNSEAPKKSLYLFYEHKIGSRKCSYSVFKIDVDLTRTTTRGPSVDLSPILEFPYEENHIRQGMKCACLGSKLYFLGGTSCRINERFQKVDEKFPRDVYVLDMLTNDFYKMDACLNAGKPDPCVVFALNGKLYALSSLNVDTLWPSPMFECFDPNTGKWQALNNLPPTKGVSLRWEGCNVLEKRQQVVLQGYETTYENKNVTFVYHLEQDKWTKDITWYPTRLIFQEGRDGEYLYGLPCDNGPPIKSKSGCLTFEDEMRLYDGSYLDIDEAVTMSIPGVDTLVEEDWADWVYTFFPRLYLYPADVLLRHIWDSYFCYMSVGMLPHPDSPDCYGVAHADLYTRCITITLFKDKEDHVGSQNLCFQADIMYTQEYRMKFENFYNAASLEGCFVVDLEQLQEKLDERKDKAKKQKINKNEYFSFSGSF